MFLNLIYFLNHINSLEISKTPNATNDKIAKFENEMAQLFPFGYDTSLLSEPKKKLSRRDVDSNAENGGVDIKGWMGKDSSYSQNRTEVSGSFNPYISLRKNQFNIQLRPDIYSLPLEERQKVINVFLKMNSGARPTVWDQITKLHILNYQYVHLQPYFLSWHRGFIYRLEQAMKDVDPTVNLPYWDWTQYNSKNPYVDPIFGDDYFGGDGDPDKDYCITNSAFAYPKFTFLYEHDQAHQEFVKRFKAKHPEKLTPLEINMLVDDDKDLTTLNTPKCLKRKFRNRDDAYMGWNDRAKMNSVESNENPIEFWHFVERGGHGYVHNAVGSERATDPLFFLLHTYVDKIWFDWQNRNPELAFKYPVKEQHLDMELNPWGITVRDLLDPVTNMGYGYSQQRYAWAK